MTINSYDEPDEIIEWEEPNEQKRSPEELLKVLDGVHAEMKEKGLA